jgi:hypothetical protein
MFNNPHFLGVTATGYFVTLPIVGAKTDEEMLEIAALIVAMKPRLRERFDAILARIESGE